MQISRILTQIQRDHSRGKVWLFIHELTLQSRNRDTVPHPHKQ